MYPALIENWMLQLLMENGKKVRRDSLPKEVHTYANKFGLITSNCLCDQYLEIIDHLISDRVIYTPSENKTRRDKLLFECFRKTMPIQRPEDRKRMNCDKLQT